MAQLYAMMLPVLPGKLDEWKQFAQNLLQERRKEYEAARLRVGIQREMIWHQATPLGDMLILVVEVEGKIESFLNEMANPQDDFTRYFLEQAKVFHGLDPENVKGMSLNQQVFQWSSPSLLEKASETALEIGQNLAGTAQSLIGKAGETAAEVGQNVAANANTLAGKAQGLAEEATQRLQKQAQEAREQLQHQAQEATGRLQSQAQEVGERLQTQAQEVKKTVEVKTVELLDKAGETVAEATHQMQAKAGEVLGNAAEVGQELADKASEVGQELAEKASGLFHHALDLLKVPHVGKEAHKDEAPETPADAGKKD